jgi:hypothetical protein
MRKNKISNISSYTSTPIATAGKYEHYNNYNIGHPINGKSSAKIQHEEKKHGHRLGPVGGLLLFL